MHSIMTENSGLKNRKILNSRYSNILFGKKKTNEFKQTLLKYIKKLKQKDLFQFSDEWNKIKNFYIHLVKLLSACFNLLFFWFISF